MAALEARVSPEKIIRMTVKGDEAGVRRVLAGMEGILSVTVTATDASAGTVSLSVNTPADADLRDHIFFAMAEERYAMISMAAKEQSLEEIFLSLTAKGGKQAKEVDA